MQALIFILNLPWTIALILISPLFSPRKVELHSKPLAIIIYVQVFRYYRRLPGLSGVRAMTLGSVILLSPDILEKDLDHELVHIKQHQQVPFLHPILNLIETIKYGYLENKYEKEAYLLSGSTYVGYRLNR